VLDRSDAFDRAGEEALDTAEGDGGLVERLEAELDVRAVVRLGQVVADGDRRHPLDDLADVHAVAERLAHLLAARSDPQVVHPEAGEPAAGCAGLGELVLVVREAKIDPAAVDVELVAEVLTGHRRALDVPARAAAAPG